MQKKTSGVARLYIKVLPEVSVKRFVTLTATVLWLVTSLSILGAQGRGRGNGKGRQEEESPKTDIAVRFSSEQVRVIRDWFASPDNLKGLPPGLAKRESLPPGLQRQLVRNGKLPPGLEKKIQPLPQEIETRLPRLPEGTRRIVISGNVILWNDKASVILDIIAKVF